MTATLTFATPTDKLNFFKALEARLVDAGYSEEQIRDVWGMNVCGQNQVTFSGREAAERAADVAIECRGVKVEVA